MINFIIETWNLDRVPFIDLKKINPSYSNGYPTLDLYLFSHIECCPTCHSKDIKQVNKDTHLIKHALRDHTYSEIIFHKRKYKCNSCGHYFKESLNSLSVIRNTSIHYRMTILDRLRDVKSTFMGLALEYHSTPTSIMYLFDRYVNVKRHALSKIVSIDEIYAKKLTKTKYACILYDPLKRIVLDVVSSRRKDALEEYCCHISIEERENTMYFTSDLNNTYRNVKKRFFKNAIHAADSFHVIKNLNEKFDNIRIKIMKEYEHLKKENDFDYWLFKKFNWMLKKGIENIHDKIYHFRRVDMDLNKYQIIEYMLRVDDTLKEAYYLKEEYRIFSNKYTLETAKESIDELIELFLNAKADEMREFGRLILNWKEEILNSFIIVDGMRLSNSLIENNNRRIKLGFSIYYGCSNFPRTRNRIMFVSNKNEPIIATKNQFSNRRIMGPRKKKPY